MLVRGQCDNTDVWTVPHDGSSGIILSVTEKRVGLGDFLEGKRPHKLSYWYLQKKWL